jgi:hypothetical protein
MRSDSNRTALVGNLPRRLRVNVEHRDLVREVLLGMRMAISEMLRPLCGSGPCTQTPDR